MEWETMPHFLMLSTLAIVTIMSTALAEASPTSHKKEFQRWAAFPAIAHNTETGLLLGGLLVRFIQPKNPKNRTETIDFIATATTNKQYAIKIAPNLYFRDSIYHLDSMIEAKHWPANYYGIGNDTPDNDDPEGYEATSFEAKFALGRKLMPSVYLGGVYQFKRESLKLEDGGLLETGLVSGTDGKIRSGLGLTFSFDSRDSINDARTGTYLKLTSINYNNNIGSDFEYTSHELKLYQYLKLKHKTGIAFGTYLRATRGDDVPFRSLSSPDGVTILRGIENGRFRERDLLAFQAEYRFPVIGRWGSVLFVDVAQVAENVMDINQNGWKSSVGTGLRYALNPSERLNVRLDISYVEEDIGVVVEIRDAF